MNTYIIEIHPKKASFDPLAKEVRRELLEAGEEPAKAVVSTNRLYRIEGQLSLDQINQAAQTLLVDPVVEEAFVFEMSRKAPKPKAKKGTTIDVWPKPGVTDPVGETVEKGLRDLGFRGDFKATSAMRYEFPKIKEPRLPKSVVKKNLANELINTVDVN